LVVANAGDGNVGVLLGDGSGGFAPMNVYPTLLGTFPAAIVVADFNRDGKADLAIAAEAADLSSNVQLYLGNGAGGFSFASSTARFPLTPIVNLAVGDFEGNGNPDVALATGGQRAVCIYSVTGTTITPFPLGDTCSASVNGVAVALAVSDFNGDGKQDLAIADLSSNEVVVWLNDGFLGGLPYLVFLGPSFFATGVSPESVAVADFNGDGIPDLLTANSDSNNVTMLLGNGSGGFSSPISFPVGVNPFAVAVGDFNGDGRPDLAVVNFNGSSVTILLGTP
jgi:hypothetical protein